MEKKITYVEAIDCALNGNLTPEVVDRLHALQKFLSTKSVDKKAEEKRERAQQGKELIMASLEVGKEYRITEIYNSVPGLVGQFEPGQVSRMVTQLHHPDMRLGRVERKGLAYFFIPENGIVEDDEE